MTPLWTSEEAAAATGGTADIPFAVTGLSIDTRSIRPGEMFIALKDQRDGHDFVAQALEKGAAAALVSRRPEGVAADAPLLVVPEVLPALEALAKAARARTRAKVIGVTGSVGKTSTKEMLRHVLSRQGRVHAAEKSFNNHWGVPLTLARMPRDADFAVIEIGMNHPGEIGPLATLADLDMAVITTVAAVHLEAFDSVDGIAREKAAIFTGLRLGGAAIINGDLETTALLQKVAIEAGGDPVLFGHEGTRARLAETRLVAGGTELAAEIEGVRYETRLSTPGRHFAMNAVAVLAAVKMLGLDLGQAARDLADWTPPAGRGTTETVLLEQGAVTLLDDAYNANPTSVGAAFEVLAATQPGGPGGRRIAVLGDMLELGPEARAIHAALAGHNALSAIDGVIAVGPLMAELDAALPAEKRLGRFATAAEAARALPGMLRAHDVVLAKGSLGSKVSQVVTALREAAKQGT
ncbi:UDP-N-acetylmuramoyl-tripeptide--D-alanyl-D-alanine ligase [Poseidonocella sp. HB161398]|uniref:UDP-N-acetylmuramoyl-tripeptide--D-alanyl-D- alanine ligase n=1 Tax=Poseidonocella sp. HB161398 TaxID=2320855 RepID=UPI001108B442|nr:UDP-N-acetylmuramoyl-tripeptide--D-alanyl-D-alanine ligase [Poseidonocella sp. HB161398]